MTPTMPIEVTMLVLAALLQMGQLVLYAVPANLEVGTARLLTPRDVPVDPTTDMTTRTARLGRAHSNHNEALLLFGIAVTAVTLSGQSSGFTGLCAVLYLLARVLYVPAYMFGWTPWRSVIWGVGFLATGLMLLACLL